MDFLRQHQCTIDIPGNCLLLANQGIKVPLQGSDCSNCSYPVRLVQTVTIPPRSEMETVGELSIRIPDCHKRLWLLEGLPQKSQVLVARSLLESSGTNIPIRLCNPTDKPITLYRTTKVGMMEEVEERQVGAVSTWSDNATRQSCSSASSGKNSHLQHLVHSASKHLTTSQKEALTSLLLKYSDIFPTPEEPLGRTAKLHHSIDTGSAHPIRQHVRRVPPAQREVVKRLLDDMLQDDVIQPSSSPWASPIVLATKKDGSPRFCVDYRKLKRSDTEGCIPIATD